MSKRKAACKTAPVAVPVAPPPAVQHGQVLSSFVREATSILNEVTAYRTFSVEITEYIEAKGLRADFDAWRAARNAPPKTS